MKTLRFKLRYFFFAALLLSCDNDDDVATPVELSTDLVIIANEGGFLAVNAEITVFDLNDSTVQQNVFQSANNQVLGDILQDIYVQGDELYAVVNNSSKIEVLGLPDFQRRRTISGISSPNAMFFISADRAYVSDLLSPILYEVNPVSGAITGQIPLPEPVDQMFGVEGEVWCSSYNGGAFVIDPNTNSVVAEIPLTIGAGGIVRDGAGKVWVICQGDYFSEPQVSAGLFRIDPATRQIISTFTFAGATIYGGKLAKAPDAQTLYFGILGDVYAMPIEQTALPTQAFVAANGRNFYGINVDPLTGDIALSDAANFVGTGKVFIYSPSGILSQEIQAGINPDDVVWARF